MNRLAFIHNAKSCGFTLKEIKKALAKSNLVQLTIEEFVAVIDKKADRIRADIAKKETELRILSQLRSDLQASNKHPEVKTTLDMLNMES